MGDGGAKWGEMGDHGKCMKIFQHERERGGNGGGWVVEKGDIFPFPPHFPRQLTTVPSVPRLKTESPESPQGKVGKWALPRNGGGGEVPPSPPPWTGPGSSGPLRVVGMVSQALKEGRSEKRAPPTSPARKAFFLPPNPHGPRAVTRFSTPSSVPMPMTLPAHSCAGGNLLPCHFRVRAHVLWLV